MTTDPAEARAARRALSDQYVGEAMPAGKPHPFGVRNGLLCEARKLAKSGNITKARKMAAQAATIAPLTPLEAENVEKAYKHYLGS